MTGVRGEVAAGSRGAPAAAKPTRTIKQDLCATGLALIETHISWVFLGERDVWKVKKPISLGFLDYSTPELRRAACEAEVELNRRLAPDVYLGVVPVTRDAGGLHHLGETGKPVDWAVHMTRLPDRDRADVRLKQRRLSAGFLDLLAGRIAAFHAAARCDAETGRFGGVEVIGRNVRENFEQTRAAIAAYLTPAEARQIERWQLQFLRRHARLFADRIAAGRVRDGHGDLRLEQIYGTDDGAIRILDCIEFNERFRYADVCADVAFLSMDLTWHGRADLAEYFLACYARETDDFELYRLVDFYESYRAYVRGKVAAILAADETAEPHARERARAEARRFFLLALASERRSLLPPVVVAVGGTLATGKSTAANRLSLDMAAPVIDSDRTRKALLGAAPTRHFADAPWQGAYVPELTSRVYDELFRRAAAVLDSGRSVVLDASFRSAALRARARRLAQERGAPFFFVECRASRDACLRRLRQRVPEQTVSDARPEILDAFLARWEPVTELPPAEHVILDTERPLEENVERLRQALPTWPPGIR